MIIINSPLSVPQSKTKKFHLNLNVYRNSHYLVLNTVKKNYKAIISDQIAYMQPLNKVYIKYTLYPKTKRLCDLSNIISIHKKFFEDALVELGKLPDDNYEHIIGSSEFFGCVDKDNPRVEIILTPL